MCGLKCCHRGLLEFQSYATRARSAVKVSTGIQRLWGRSVAEGSFAACGMLRHARKKCSRGAARSEKLATAALHRSVSEPNKRTCEAVAGFCRRVCEVHREPHRRWHRGAGPSWSAARTWRQRHPVKRIGAQKLFRSISAGRIQWARVSQRRMWGASGLPSQSEQKLLQLTWTPQEARPARRTALDHLLLMGI